MIALRARTACWIAAALTATVVVADLALEARLDAEVARIEVPVERDPVCPSMLDTQRAKARALEEMSHRGPLEDSIVDQSRHDRGY